MGAGSLKSMINTKELFPTPSITQQVFKYLLICKHYYVNVYV
jgi:hypothetical protein